MLFVVFLKVKVKHLKIKKVLSVAITFFTFAIDPSFINERNINGNIELY